MRMLCNGRLGTGGRGWRGTGVLPAAGSHAHASHAAHHALQVVRPIMGISFAPDQSVEQVRLLGSPSLSLAFNLTCSAEELRGCIGAGAMALALFAQGIQVEAGQALEKPAYLLCLPPPAQLGLSGVLVLDARKGGPAFKAGIMGTTRDEYGR